MAAGNGIISFESMPLGCRFQPTEEECLTFYLKRRIWGNRRYLHVIPELNIYDSDPCELPQKFKESSVIQSKDQEWWFMCPLQFTTSSKSKTRRKTKSGFWKITGKPKDVNNKSGEKIGVMRILVFCHGCNNEETDWVMHQYRLTDNGTSAIIRNQEELVLCRVMKRSEDASSEYLYLDSDDEEAEHNFSEEAVQATMKPFSDLLALPVNNHSLGSQSNSYPKPDEFYTDEIVRSNPEDEHDPNDDGDDDDHQASSMQIDLGEDSVPSNETLTEDYGQENYQINQSRQDCAMKAPCLSTTPLETTSTYAPTPPSVYSQISYCQTSNRFIYSTPSPPEIQSLNTTISPITSPLVPTKDYIQNPITQDVIPIAKEYLQNFMEMSPLDIVMKFFPEEFNFQPTNLWKNRNFYELILISTDSVEISHIEKEGVITCSTCIIKRIVTLEQWNQQPWMPKNFSQPFSPQVYDYYDYIKAWEVVFLVRNYSHYWYIQFNNQLVKDFPPWFIAWFGYYGLSEKIFPEEVYAKYELFKTHGNEPSYVKLLKFSAEFGLGWILSWNYVIEPGQFGQPYVKSCFWVKWLEWFDTS